MHFHSKGKNTINLAFLKTKPFIFGQQCQKQLFKSFGCGKLSLSTFPGVANRISSFLNKCKLTGGGGGGGRGGNSKN